MLWYDQRWDYCEDGFADLYIQESYPIRHTIDVRAAEVHAIPNQSGYFSYEESIQVSRYPYVFTPDFTWAIQLQYNMPNLPIFGGGTVPFLGDYIDITPSPMFIFEDEQWKYNTYSNSVYHAVWTDNRDVRPPGPDLPPVPDPGQEGDWVGYVAPGENCGAPSQTGIRNQNIYTSRITEGIIAGSPGNTKPLNMNRAFVVFVKNTTGTPLDLPRNLILKIIETSGATAYFMKAGEDLGSELEVKVPPQSSVSATVMVESSSDQYATVRINVYEGTDLLTYILLNPDSTNPGIEPHEGWVEGSPHVGSEGETHTPHVGSQDVINWDYDYDSPHVGSEDATSPHVGSNDDTVTPHVGSDDDIIGGSYIHVNPTNNHIIMSNFVNPHVGSNDFDATPVGTSMTDIIWTVENTGNTTSTFSLSTFPFYDYNPEQIAVQLIVYKVYTTPTALGCELKEQEHHELIVSQTSPHVGSDDEFPSMSEPWSFSDVTFSIPPKGTGEQEVEYKVILRYMDKDTTDGIELNPEDQGIIVRPEAPDIINGAVIPPASALVIKTRTIDLDNGIAGDTYSETLEVMGGYGNYAWSLGGTASNWLSIDSTSNGLCYVSGTPSTAGTYTLTVTVDDIDSDYNRPPLTATKTLSIRIAEPLEITGTSPSPLPSGTVDMEYSGVTVEATGGIEPYAWSVTSGSLPNGLSLDESSGEISGTPEIDEVTYPYTYYFTVQVSDQSHPQQTTTLDLSISISMPIGPQPAVLYGVNSSDDGLSIINPTSGEVTFIGPLDPDPNKLVTPVAMAVRPADGKIFVWNNSDKDAYGNTVQTGVLLTVDPSTGLASKVNPYAPNQGVTGALAFSPDGRLYGFSYTIDVSENLYEINLTTGEKELVGSIGDFDIFGADFNANGVLYGLTIDQKLVTINTNTCATTLVGQLSENIGTPGSIVFDPTGTLIGSAFSGPSGDILFDIDPANGAVTNIRTISVGTVPQGMGFVFYEPGNLSFQVQPSDTVGDQPISPAVQVKAEGEEGEPLPGVALTIKMGINPCNGTLSGGTTALTGLDGIATFSNLSIDKGGYGYTLEASSVGLTPIVSNSFNIEGFCNTDDLSTARRGHTATLLPDGKVLITGGQENGTFLSSAELYDPTTGSFSSTGSMSVTRQYHRATLLPTGNVLITGGSILGGTTLASAELYDPISGTFSYTDAMENARENHTATLLTNGNVLISGGRGNPYTTLDGAELYDPSTGTFSSTGSMNTPRKQHSATLLANGMVLVAGGYYTAVLNSAELYDPDTGTFGPLEHTMNTPRTLHTATLLSNGNVLIAGGGPSTESAELYDPNTDTFSTTGSMSETRVNHTATLLSTGNVLIIGGSPITTAGSTAEVYDPTSGTFRPTGSLGAARELHTASRLPDGKVLVTGGSASSSSLDSAETFYPRISIVGGLMMGWGGNHYGKLGDGTTTDTNTPVQVIDTSDPTGKLTDVLAAGAGSNHSLVLKSNGSVWAWGFNGWGSLGDGTTDNSNTAVQVIDPNDPTGKLTEVVAISAGYSHNLALKSEGTVWAWGWNAQGQLGDDSTTDRNKPVQVIDTSDPTGKLTDVVAVTASYTHSLALKSDGTVWAWGANSYGKLGDGTTDDSHTAVQVVDPYDPTGYISDVVAIAAGDMHSLALKSDGTVWAWGYSNCGQLGHPGVIESHTPVQVLESTEPPETPFTGVKAIAAGSIHSLALKIDGTVWGWGRNENGQVGDGTTVLNINLPVQASGLTEVIAIAARYNHSLALKSDGNVWAWGYNYYGQLGDGTNADRNAPVQVQNLAYVVAIACGTLHSTAIIKP